MGLAASQARLLFLTSRMSDLELRAQVISNSKIRLAMQSSSAAMKYTRELDKKKLQIQEGFNNGSPTYKDATAANVTAYSPFSQQRIIKNAAGQVVISDKMANDYNNVMDTPILSTTLADKTYTNSPRQLQMSTLDVFLKNMLGYSSINEFNNQNPNATDAEKTKAQNKINYYTNCYTGQEVFMQKQGYTSNPDNTNPSLKYDQGATSHYANLYTEMKNNNICAVSDQNFNSSSWLENGVRGEGLYLETPQDPDGDGVKDWENVSWTTGDNGINEVDDTAGAAKAEAEYESEMAQIQVKDKRFDMELKQVDTEHQATQATIDSVKKIIEKNIERSLKMFQA